MKLFLFLSVLIAVTFSSCRRDNLSNPSGTLNGNWLMIRVVNNASGAVTTKPASVTGDVIVRFNVLSTLNGNFTGNTPSNQIDHNN